MKMLRYLLVLAVASVLMASCGYPDHLKTLPKETVAVVSFDLAGMAAKGDLDKLQEADFYKKMQEKMAEKDAESAKETDEFLKNPLNYGINFIEPVYLFVVNNGADKKPSVGFSIALGDADKFKTFITKILKEEDKEPTIEAGTGYSFINTSEATVAWNDAALIVVPKLAKAEDVNLDNILNPNKEGSVTDVAGFKSFYKKSQDISGWMSFNVLGTIMDAAKEISPEDPDLEYLENYQEQLDKFKDASFQFHVSFNKDEIYTEYLTDLPDDLQKMYSEEVLRSGVPDKMANLIKSTDLGVLSLSLNLQNYMKMMSDNPALDEKTREQMKQYIAMAQQFIAPFDGDILFTLSDIKETEREVTESIPVESEDDDLTASTDEDEYEWDWDMEYRDTTYIKKETVPVFLAATTVNDETFGFLGMMMGKDKPKAGKVTETDLGGSLSVYSTIVDKMVVIGNDKATIEAIAAGTFKGDPSCDMAKGAAGHGSYFYANLDMTKYPKVVQDKIAEAASKQDEKGAALVKLLGMFDKVEAYNKANYTAVLSLKLKPNGNNSLYTLIEYTGNAAYDMGAFN